MIKTLDNAEDIITLWHEAFGDSREDILYFVNNLKHGKCIGCYEGDTLVSMLYLVGCSYKHCNTEYVYAACTLKEYRGRGYMSKLLDYCKRNSMHGFCLIPANEGLVEYYKRQGLTRKISFKDISFAESDEICEYLFEGCELEEPFALMFDKGE